ncbi:protein Cep78 homolog [Anopheles maculipalpis]|uniref:protein Cep78 homolog n=1 Tax=Anopheles maculipalpis TaxID=1496333 RepID=UPI00215972A9|nr:protein Cep78 homolog [Anopheles maculipalpis]
MSSDTNNSTTKTTNRNERRNRQRNKNFHHRYLALCRSKNFQPLPEIVKPKQKDQVFLDVYGDRFKANDWQLIVDALREDNSIDHLALRLRKTHIEGTDGLTPASVLERHGTEKAVFLDKRLFKQLVDTLAIFLRTNKVVKYFAIEGFPLAGVRLCTLITGLVDNTSLTELNLARCSIGDEGCKALCNEVKFFPNLLVLNLTACQLTAKGCQAVAEVIKFQKMQRYAASWEQSLRYGDIKEDKLMGLRYLYLSHNPGIGDYGLLELTDILKDDVWVRQIHVCNCGLTDTGAQFLIECLNMNAAIEKFDIRDNNKISNEACHEILLKLGVKLEEDDGSDSGTSPSKYPKTMAGLRERCEHLEMQLNNERNRRSQLESQLEQQNQQLGDYATQLKELQFEMNALIKSRNDVLEMLKKAESKSTKAKKAGPNAPLRKSQSDAFAIVSQEVSACETIMANISKSEIVLNAEKDLSTVSTANRFIERSIGDGGGDAVEKEAESIPEKI